MKETLGRKTECKGRERRKINTEAECQLSGVTYMQPCHWVRESMKYGQRVGAEGLIKKTEDILDKRKHRNRNHTHQKLLFATLLVTGEDAESRQR